MSSSISDRNNMIRLALEENRTPLLRFELDIINRDMRSHVNEQQKLGAIMREAMTQSSETWHDNAPAEAIANESKILNERAGRIANLVGSRAVFDYVSTGLDDQAIITLGSVVDLMYEGDTEVERVVITGMSRELTPEAEQVVNDGSSSSVEAVTISSPLGAALLGGALGDTLEFNGPRGRIVRVQILSIEHLSLS